MVSDKSQAHTFFPFLSILKATSSPSAPFPLPNIAQLGTINLDGTSYLSWLLLIVLVLQSYELMGIFDRSDPCPPKFLPPGCSHSNFDSNPNYSI